MFTHSIKIAAATAALLFTVGAASAAELPKSGMVNREGTVERIVNNNTFILRDKLTNKTVDVHTAANNQVAVGDHVLVKGKAESEMLGMGHQIVNASITMQTSGASPSAGGMGGPYAPLEDNSTNTNTDARIDNKTTGRSSDSNY